MSRYVIRNVEGRFRLIAGTIYGNNKLPDTAPEGTYYRTYNSEANYMVFERGKWVPKDTCPVEWRPLCVYTQSTGAPKESGYESEREQTEEFKSPDERLVYFFRHEEFTNNGGPIRDDYISSNGWGSDLCNFRSRGLPVDISPDTRKAIEYHGELIGWDYTWCTLDEWYQLYELEQNRILGKIMEAQVKQFNKTTDRKLDFIIRNMKDPYKMNLKEIYPEKKDDDDFDEDEYYESPQVIIDEEFDKLFVIAQEYGRILQIADFYGFEYSPEDVRIIYHITG